MSLRLWLPLNGDLHNQGLDEFQPTATNYNVIDNGKIGKCVIRKTTSSGIDTGFSGSKWNINETSLTFAGWFKFPRQEITELINSIEYTSTSRSTGMTILGHISYSGVALYTTSNDIYSSGSFSELDVFCTIRQNSSLVSSSAYSLPFDTWVHLCGVFDRENTKMSLYVNGQLITTKSIGYIPSECALGTFKICHGQAHGGSPKTPNLPVYCNDVRLYDESLTPKQIKELSKGLVLHYPLNRGGFGADNLAPISSYGRSNGGNVYPPNTNNSLVINGNRFIVTANPGDSIGAVATNISSSTITISAKTTYTGTGRATYRKWFDDSGNMVGSYISERITLENGRILCTLNVPTGATKLTFGLCYPYNEPYEVWDLKVEEGSIATPWVPNSSDALYSSMGLDDGIEYDVNGYGNNGTITGDLTYTSDTPRYLASTSFNGTSYISITSPSTEVKTISFWANWDAIPSGQSVLFVDGKSHIGFGLMSYGILCGTSGIGDFKTFSKTSLVANEWYHFVIVNPGDATSLDRKLYINGVEQTATTRTSKWTHGVDQLQLGKRVSTSDGFKGKMSDFRMYATALSADDILSLYHTPASIASNGTLLTQGEISEV